MADKKYFSYIRVSTVRQGQTGTSLTEQRSAIERHAQRWNLKIVREFEEQETAAKMGRPIFRSMLKELRQGRAAGVLMHKIDRSARNLKDWAELGELIDKGVEVHFANENLDLYTRGGRLSADIQAVVAADYIRNLREEVKKGFYGRLKQGLYPMPAPIGYLDGGPGKIKEIDPIRGPFIRKAFELYATGEYGLKALTEIMKKMGLRGKEEKPVSLTTLARTLHNPFYTGIIRLKKTGELYPAQHQPLISSKLFHKVQDVLSGKAITRSNKVWHDEVFLFRKLLTCDSCKYRLVGEKQKTYIYYRCHTVGCPQKTIRDELIENSFIEILQSLKFTNAENEEFKEWIESRQSDIAFNIESEKKALELQLSQIHTRLSRLTDALVDGLIEERLFLQKKNNLVEVENELKTKLIKIETSEPEALRKTEKFIELVNSACLSYQMANFQNKRHLIRSATSNFFISNKKVVIKLNLPFKLIVNRQGEPVGGAQRNGSRVLKTLLTKLTEYFLNNNYEFWPYTNPELNE